MAQLLQTLDNCTVRIRVEDTLTFTIHSFSVTVTVTVSSKGNFNLGKRYGSGMRSATYYPSRFRLYHVAIPTDVSLLSPAGGKAARRVCNV